MRHVHRLRVLRRSRNFNPLTILSAVQQAGKLAQAAQSLSQAPQRLQQLGQAAQTVTDSRLAERVGQTAQELTQTARWIKYAAIGGVGVAGLLVIQRVLSPK